MTSLPLAKHEMREPVAFGAGGERSAGDLLRDAAKVAAQLTAAEGEAQLLIAIGRDRYAFAAALLGTWARGYCAAITPHTGRDAIIASAPHCAAVIHDGVTSAPLRIDELLAGEDVGPLALSLPDRLVLLYREDRDGSWITSSKRRHQLLDEAAVLVASFELGRGLRYANTLPIGEPYGFMLGLLVPLISGGAFQREVSNTATDEPADVLVSAPRQLRRMRERKRFAQLFSAPTLETEEPKLQPQLERLESKLAGISGVEDFLVVAVADELFALLVASTRSEAELAAEVAGFDGAGTNLARVARLPRFGDDRASRARLLQHFRRDADGRPLSFQLAWRDERVLDEGEQRRRVFRAHVPPDYGYFAGHFTGYPILPGAAQLSELVLPCVRRARPELGPLRQMSRIKFANRIKPDERVDVELAWRNDEPQIDFALRRGDAICSAGKLNFESSPPSAAEDPP